MAVAIGGVAWVFLYPLLSGERQAEKRRASVARRRSRSQRATARAPQKSRREQVEETLKELEIKNEQAEEVRRCR